jgi:hypothetical protein
MKNAIAANWVAEICEDTFTGFKLKGTSKGYTTFKKAFSAGNQVFYSAHDGSGNREAGYATFNGSELVDRHATASLVNGVYQDQTPGKVRFTGDVTVACTFNAVEFNTLWKVLDEIGHDGDGGINIPPELIDGLVVALDHKAEQADLESEIQARIAGDADLQAQIDAIDPDGGGAVGWDEIEGKPGTFPPATHNHDGDYLKAETDPTVPAHVKAIKQSDIDTWNAGGSGGASTWDELTGKPTEFPPAAHNQGWDTITGTPSEFPPESHTHEIDDVTGLQDALDAAGGTPAWDDVTGKPTEFPPEAHTHEQSEVDGLEDRLTAIEGSISSGGGFVDAPNDGKLYGRQSEAWAEVVVPDAADPDWSDIQNKPTEFPPADHDQPWDSITGKPAKFPPESHTHDYLTEAPDDGAQYARQSVNSKMVWSVVSGESLVHVDEDAPEDPATGQLWFDTDSGTLNLFDGDDWINIATGSKTVFTLPVSSRSGVLQLPVSEDADSLPVLLRSGEFAIPLNQSGDILAVNTRGGEVQLPLAS